MFRSCLARTAILSRSASVSSRSGAVLQHLNSRSSDRNYNSWSNGGSGGTSPWMAVGAGLALGAAGVAYTTLDDRNIAKCGQSDNWVYKSDFKPSKHENASPLKLEEDHPAKVVYDDRTNAEKYQDWQPGKTKQIPDANKRETTNSSGKVIDSSGKSVEKQDKFQGGLPDGSGKFVNNKKSQNNTNNNAKAGKADTGSESEQQQTPDPSELPSHVPYLIIGAGTAAMAAYRAIRSKHANAKVLLVGDEEYKPYMRPPLSKDMWFTEDKSLTKQLKFKTWSGRERSVFFEKDQYYCQPGELVTNEKGGVAVATGRKVVKLNTSRKQATLSDGSVISYDRCLIATGGRPRNLPVLERAGKEVSKRVTLFRGIDDFNKLNAVTDKVKSVVVIGGGFLGSEIACALGKKSANNGMNVTQVFPESGNMGKVLPEYLSLWTTYKVRSENVNVIPEVMVKDARMSDNGKDVELSLSNDDTLLAEHIVVAVGLEPNTDLSDSAGLEVNEQHGGFNVNSELEAGSNVWVAGDAACFYDVKLGRRRVEHHDHAVVSGRLAGENMTGAGKRLLHQSMFWSDLGPDVGYEAIGLVDSELPTVAVFARSTNEDTPAAAEEKSGESLRSEAEQEKPASFKPQAERGDDYNKGVIFYMKGKKVVGVVCWNVFNKIGIARKIIKEGAEHEDLSEVAKLFDLHPPRVVDDEEAASAKN